MEQDQKKDIAQDDPDAIVSVRKGWAEASRALAEAGDDALAWPEFANEDDETWTF
jgi:hypothetical protein